MPRNAGVPRGALRWRADPAAAANGDGRLGEEIQPEEKIRQKICRCNEKGDGAAEELLEGRIPQGLKPDDRKVVHVGAKAPTPGRAKCLEEETSERLGTLRPLRRKAPAPEGGCYTGWTSRSERHSTTLTEEEDFAHNSGLRL
jgi:hypothetical protein